ncbi:alkaline phosphatase family protein [Candidatus Dependentiae bacterium]|nr:alkaline phosphatase family protein [Candidatus Dependentiae bacterium]
MQRASFFIVLLFTGTLLAAEPSSPKMTVVFVIDQLSAEYLEKLRPLLKGGIATMWQNGVEYTNAFYDASPPSTAHGHALLTTGTYGALHGIVGNSWRTKDLGLVECDDDSAEQAAVFAPKGALCSYGKSAKNMLVDNLSDQLKLHSYPHARNTVWSLSLKSRAAILMGGKMGSPVWFNNEERQYTSSKAYFKKMPQWITEVNEKLALDRQEKITWKPLYPLCGPMYAFDNASDYLFARVKKPLINSTHDLSTKKAFNRIYGKSPQATADFFTLAKACINANYKEEQNERFILWLNLASLDKVAHSFGPYSKEALDTLYHMDHQMGLFIKEIYKKVPKEDVLFVLTGDHGGQPIPEIINQKGYTAARRYYAPTILENLNKLVEEKYGIKKLVRFFSSSQFFLDMTRLTDLKKNLTKAIMGTMKEHLVSLPGIRKAWTFDELQKTIFEKYDLDSRIKKELYPGRSGHLFYSTDPYTALYGNKKGGVHSTQYAYDTRVPLIFYQAGRFKPRRIHTTRYITQVSPTLAALLNVPRPSAAVARVLPELLP